MKKPNIYNGRKRHLWEMETSSLEEIGHVHMRTGY